MSEEIKIDRLNRIMEVAKMMHDNLWSKKLLRLARQASDIYATAKEEIEARSMLKEETVTDCNQLPDWCKVGEWYYDKVIKQYLQIDSFDMAHKARWGQDLKNGVIVQARKRPYNAEEMRGLLGKVIVDGESEFFVSAYYGEVKYLAAGLFCEFDAQSLMRCSCDGKPCYVLEHLENGEWVE